MLDMGEGMLMGFLLWHSDGYPDCLEGYQYCDDFGNEVDLKQRPLELLKFSKLQWLLKTVR